MTASSMPFEVLHLALMLLGGLARREGAEISAPAGLGIDLAGIQAVFAGLELAAHGQHPCVAVALLRFKAQLAHQLLLFGKSPLHIGAVVRGVEIERFLVELDQRLAIGRLLAALLEGVMQGLDRKST